MRGKKIAKALLLQAVVVPSRLGLEGVKAVTQKASRPADEPGMIKCRDTSHTAWCNSLQHTRQLLH